MNRTDEIVEVNGVKIPINSKVLSPLLIKSIRNKRYEFREAKELPSIIQEKERVLEVGAGIGFISSLIALNPKTQVIKAIEANPLLIEYIKETHRLNNIDGVEVLWGVLAAENAGNVPFYIREHFWASSLSPGPSEYREKIHVPVLSFKDLINAFRPSMIVCDIEGGELNLFEDVDLRGVEKIYLELHQKIIGRCGVKHVFDVLGQQNFHYDQFHSERGVVLFSHVDRDNLRIERLGRD